LKLFFGNAIPRISSGHETVLATSETILEIAKERVVMFLRIVDEDEDLSGVEEGSPRSPPTTSPVCFPGASDSLAGREVGAGSLESMSVDSWAELEYADGTTVTVTGRATLALANGTQKSRSGW
jgi:hypothetical protein